MHYALLLAGLFLAPAPAEAKVDFKCESVNYSDQISGWIRFGYGARNNSLSMEYWNDYPPITLVESDMDNGTEFGRDQIRFVTQADRSNGTVATLETDKGAYHLEKFNAKIEMQNALHASKKLRAVKYDLKCVRH
jgi:hypothetical protein